MADEEKSLKELQAENIRVTNEHLRAQTEYFNEQNELLRAKRTERKRQHTTQEETLAQQRQNDRVMQRGCTHRKGGKGDDLKNNRGQDPNHAIILCTGMFGVTTVDCTRCWAHWKPGDTARNHPTGIAYETAVNWPTDNSPMATAQFRLPTGRVEEPVASD